MSAWWVCEAIHLHSHPLSCSVSQCRAVPGPDSCANTIFFSTSVLGHGADIVPKYQAAGAGTQQWGTVFHVIPQRVGS